MKLNFNKYKNSIYKGAFFQNFGAIRVNFIKKILDFVNDYT